jgi:predicted ATPase
MECQLVIAKNQITGHYIKFKGERIDINSNGELSKWPSGLYDRDQILMSKLFKVIKENRLKSQK